MNNFAAALKAEAKRVVRCWQRYDHEQRSLLASANLKYRSREGEYFYVHPALPNVAFPTRKRAAEAALDHNI